MATLVDFKVGMRVRVVTRIFDDDDDYDRIDEGFAVIKKINQGDRCGVHADVEFDDTPRKIYDRWIFAKDQDESLDCCAKIVGSTV